MSTEIDSEHKVNDWTMRQLLQTLLELKQVMNAPKPENHQVNVGEEALASAYQNLATTFERMALRHRLDWSHYIK